MPQVDSVIYRLHCIRIISITDETKEQEDRDVKGLDLMCPYLGQVLFFECGIIHLG